MLEATKRLPAAFVGKPLNPIKRKTRGASGLRRLPFVAGRRTASESPFWNVPPTGGYFGGYETGEAMALALLKHLREDRRELAGYCLTKVVESFMRRFEQEGGQSMAERPISEWSDSFDAFRGQYAGFFNTVSHWLHASAVSLGSNLDQLTEQELVRRANAGLGFKQAAFMASLLDSEE